MADAFSSEVEEIDMTRTSNVTVVCIALVGALLPFAGTAGALTIGNSNELGFVLPGIPLSNQDKEAYVNQLIGMTLGAIDLANGQVYHRSSNAFGALPNAVWALNGTGTTVNLGANHMYSYLLATYVGFGSEVWYVGNLSGTITIPGSFLTQWALFRPGVPGVPDGGSAAMLLGAGFAALGLAQRFLKRQAS
jgi:hypothetical protein